MLPLTGEPAKPRFSKSVKLHVLSGESGIRIAPPHGSTARETLWRFHPFADKSGVGIVAEGSVITPDEFAEAIVKKAIENVKHPPIAVHYEPLSLRLTSIRY